MPDQPQLLPGCKFCAVETNRHRLAPGFCPLCGGTVASTDPSVDCALDLQTGRCTLEATAHCRQACPYQAMLREGSVPASPAEVIA